MQFKKNSRIHIISIGGSVMHDLAINLKKLGHIISGSDDIIYDPSKSNLKKYGLLPSKLGYYKQNITRKIDIVITGMHTKKNNIEIKESKKLKIPIYSYPEIIRNFSENKHRIVIAGSHGKTTVTSMIMHVLKFNKINFDYLIGAKVSTFKRNLKLSNDPIIIIEGDEYLTSPLDRQPKFLKYDHHIVLINGIEWDHYNVFKTEKKYQKQFHELIKKTPKGGEVIFYEKDENIHELIQNIDEDLVTVRSYSEEKSLVNNGDTYLTDSEGKNHQIKLFGRHNMQNISAAKTVCEQLGIKDKRFFKAISSYKLPENRLQILLDKKIKIFRDFAHSPSKLNSTIDAVKNNFNNKLLVIYELHSSSSLNVNFLPKYKNTINQADDCILYLSQRILDKNKIKDIDLSLLKKCFNNKKIKLINDRDSLLKIVSNINYKPFNKLFMSSGNFDGLNFDQVINENK